MIYDATLFSSQRAKPPQTSFDPNANTRMWQENGNLRQRAQYRYNRAQERAYQARREDTEYWSGPTYTNAATNHSEWGKEWDWEQEDQDDLDNHDQRSHAARKEASREARKEAKRKMHNMNTPPPQHQFDQSTEDFKARAEKHKEQQEARKRTEKETFEDDSCWGRPPSPEQPDLDWSDKAEKEFQKRFERAKKQRSDQRKAEREKSEKDLLAEILLLLSKILSIQIDIRKIDDEVDQPSKATKVHGSRLIPPLRLLSEQRYMSGAREKYVSPSRHEIGFFFLSYAVGQN